jgi:hypothetical protein
MGFSSPKKPKKSPKLQTETIRKNSYINQRGRPRTKPYLRFDDFLRQFEKLKKDYLFRREIVKTIYRAAWRNLEERDNIVYVDAPGVAGSKIKRLGKRWKDHGEVFICKVCGTPGRGKDFTIDLDHKPPRIRFTLECGHRQELIIWISRPDKCPKCGARVLSDEEGYFFVQCSWRHDFGE